MTFKVAVVGGGFSGTMVLANLVRNLTGPVSIGWFEERRQLGQGAAYGTTDPVHLLNVPASRMGAFAGEADGFYQWLQTPQGTEAAHVVCPEKKMTADAFMPRALYAHYIQSILQQTLQAAKQKAIDIRIHHTRVTDAAFNQTLSLSAEGMEPVKADALVLATGNLTPRAFAFEAALGSGAQHYIANSWQGMQEKLSPAKIGAMGANDTIVIIGTGLTTVDIILTLTKHKFKGNIVALSRNGKFPASHAAYTAYPEWQWLKDIASAPRTARGLLQGIKHEIRTARAQGYDWRSVVDSLRPITPALWQRLAPAEKQTFLKRLATAWNIHRHRMAPEIHAQLQTLLQAGSLKVIAGNIRDVKTQGNGLQVTYRERGNGNMHTIDASLLINCTGPDYNIATCPHALLKSLHAQDLIRPNQAGIGIAMTAHNTAQGNAPDTIFAIGPLLIGELLECTAVPELREQAQIVANALIARISNAAKLR